jgi:hypothetical protein
MKTTGLMLAAAVAAVAAGPVFAADVATIDWSKVPENAITLFYPGQSSYKWVSTEHSKKGREGVQKGQACTRCHEGEEKELGASLVKGGPLEPNPVKGKPGSVDLKLQVAYDARNAYFRAAWKSANPYPGTEHQYLRFDGKEWKVYGYPKLDQVVQEGQQPGLYEDRFSIMLDDGKVPTFAQQGCWLTCHEGERDMPGFAQKDAVQANALMAALKKNDIRKYLPATRTDPHDWKTGKAVEDIARLKAEGHFLELIQWRAHRSNAVGMADDGYVLEWRNFDEGKNMFGGNADAATHAPKLMWDDRKVGYKSITAEQLRKGEHFLVKDVNAVPFDPNAGWKVGDLIPDYYVSRADAKGSAADNTATSTWKDGVWTVVIVRPLGLANADDKALKEGGTYNVGFAVHDDNITTRGHHVSFVRTLGFGAAKADIQATKLP